MVFERQLFISYAHLDNKPLSPEHEGWITRLHQSLEAVLGMRLGREPEIWRDKKLDGNDMFSDEIEAQFEKTAVLVSVISPRYVESKWCAREANHFVAAAEHSGGVVVDNKSRIFKVIKYPVESEQGMPDAIRDAIGYAFYTHDEADDTPLELDPAFGRELGEKYNRKLVKLSADIAALVKRLETGTQPPEGPAIYLAECTWELRDTRDALQTELERHGYRVLPERQLPRDEGPYLEEVRRNLGLSDLAVHFVSKSYGAVPPGPSQKSVVVLQNEEAIRVSKARGLPRIVWLPDGTRSDHPLQQQFIDQMHRDPGVQFAADLITGNLENLKEAVHAALKIPSTADRGASERGPRLIYLICDVRDRGATMPIRKFLKSRGFDVSIPAFEGTAAEVRESNSGLLAQCDARLIYYGAGDEAWKRTLENDLRKMTAFRDKELLGNCVYVAQPSTADKQELLELEPNVINGLGGFSEEALGPFLKGLEG